MSVSSGFFNSLNADREYDATQMSQIFDGVIEDGIYMSIGNRFSVRAYGNNMQIIVGTGRAWFNHTWILNDANMVLTVEQSEAVMERIDAVVIKVDHTDAVRADSIEIVKGVPAASDPQKPDLVDTSTVFYHPIAYITVGKDVGKITNANIENVVGTEVTPYVLAPVQNMHVDELIQQWRAQYGEAMEEDQQTFDDMITEDNRDFTIWFNTIKDIVIEESIATRLSEMITSLTLKWEDFTRTGTFFDALEDEDGNYILDEYGDTLIGATIYVKYAQYQALRKRVDDIDHKGS